MTHHQWPVAVLDDDVAVVTDGADLVALAHVDELGDPLAPVVRVDVHPRSGHRAVVVACPHCEREHRHGVPGVEDVAGHRVAHCSAGRSLGYFVHDPDGLAVIPTTPRRPAR